MILSLDLGLKTGVAVRTKLGIKSCTIYLKKNGKTFEQQLVYFYHFLNKINEISHLHGEELEVVFEMPHGGYFASTRILFSLIGCIYLFSGTTGVKTTEYSPKSIKKFWTNNGNASKEEMMEVTKAKYGKPVADDNESDAVAQLFYHISLKGS